MNWRLAFAVNALVWGLGIMTRTGIPGLFIGLWHGFFIGLLAYWSARDQRLAIPFYVLTAILLIGGSEFARICTGTAVLLYAAMRTGYIGRGLNWRWLQSLGTVSYSLYLTHGPIQGAAFFVAAKIIPGGATAQAFQLVVATLACVAFAGLFWMAIERPSQSLAHRVIARRAR